MSDAIARKWRFSPAYDASGISAMMRDGNPTFIEGRDRLIASAREAGLPWYARISKQ